MSRLHDHGKRVAPLPVDCLLSHFILTILNNSSTRIRKWTPGLSRLQIIPGENRNMFLGAGFSEREIDTVADSFVEKLMVFGSESKIKEHLQELFATEIDELAIRLIGVSDPVQEQVRLARLMGRL